MHGKSTALLVFTLTLGLFVAEVFSPYGARANLCDPGTPSEQAHEDAHGIPCTDPGHDRIHGQVIDVNAGRDQELRLDVFPPKTDSRLYLDNGDQMVIKLEGFDLSDADFRTQEVDGRTEIADIEIIDSVDAPKLRPTAVRVDSFEKSLTLTLPDLTNHAHSAGEHLIIIIRNGTGILAPEIPRGFDEKEDPYGVEISFIDSDDGRPRSAAAEENFIAVRNPISSTVPGADVRVELATFAENVIHGTDEISVDFSGLSVGASFTVPETILASTVQIRHGDRTYNPSSVLVQGQKVILTVPSGEDPRVQIVGDYTITFSQSAEIKNPFSAGNRIITVSSFVHGDDQDQIAAVIRRTTSVTPGKGVRGSAFTLEGRGYAEGTVTVFDGNDDRIGPGETLGSVETVKGAFKVKLKAGGEEGKPVYTVRTKDSYGVNDSADFTITSSMSFEPASVGVGSRLRITVSDWNKEQEGVAAVRIAGQPAYPAGAREQAGCFEYSALSRPDDDSVVTVDVVVPPEVPPGRQTVSIYGPDQLQSVGAAGADEDACLALRDEPNPIITKTIEIAAQALALSPDSAARGEKITITGSGFTQAAGGGDDIQSVSIGGIDVDEDPSGFEVGSGGDVTLIVTVPLEVSNGANEVRVEGAGQYPGSSDPYDSGGGDHARA